jgi:hypothetical protein
LITSFSVSIQSGSKPFSVSIVLEMAISPILRFQVQLTSITKASLKSLSIVLSPCLSISSDAPVIDLSHLLPILVTEGAFVFGYSFLRAVAVLPAPTTPQLVVKSSKRDPWVNQKLERVRRGKWVLWLM